jgi:hypothetical protein
MRKGMSVHVVEGVQEATARRVHAEFETLCGHLNVLHARMVQLVAEALAVDAWGGPGLRSPEHWLAWQTGLSPRRAKRIVAMARQRDELPLTFASTSTPKAPGSTTAPASPAPCSKS